MLWPTNAATMLSAVVPYQLAPLADPLHAPRKCWDLSPDPSLDIHSRQGTMSGERNCPSSVHLGANIEEYVTYFEGKESRFTPRVNFSASLSAPAALASSEAPTLVASGLGGSAVAPGTTAQISGSSPSLNGRTPSVTSLGLLKWTTLNKSISAQHKTKTNNKWLHIRLNTKRALTLLGDGETEGQAPTSGRHRQYKTSALCTLQWSKTTTEYDITAEALNNEKAGKTQSVVAEIFEYLRNQCQNGFHKRCDILQDDV
ncbi:hypothetical protein Tco_0892774 [Tanacetum coccineum]|uniref:Uncharacterized protein n=1 Tax=Tanacetum coccineum TaxID=301880 RepID=A0ABQ5C8K6_9ASTR